MSDHVAPGGRAPGLPRGRAPGLPHGRLPGYMGGRWGGGVTHPHRFKLKIIIIIK